MAKLPLLEQIQAFTGRLSKIQMITIGAVVIGVIGLMTLLLTSTTEPQMSVLFSELEQKDASLIIEKLKEKQVAYELSANGSTILVPNSVLHETRLALASEGLPQSSVVGYEIFDKTNLGMSDFVQKLNYQRALEGELVRTIGTIDEVQKARVHIVIPEKALFDKDQKKPTASVILHLKSGRGLSKINIDGIQNLVASSVEGMQTTEVIVVDQRGQILSEPVQDKNSIAGTSSTQYEQQQKVDQYLTQKVQSLMDGVLGTGNAIIRVNAELDFTQTEKTIEDYDPDRQVVRSEQVVSGLTQSKDSLSFPAVNSENQQSNTITNYEISKTVEKIVGGVGRVKRLSVAALVNGTTKVIEKNGEPAIQYTPRRNDEMQKLNDIVKNAIGYDPSRNDQVSVLNIQFDNSLQEEELKNQSLDILMTPEEITEKLLLAAAMIIAVLMIRKLFASPPVIRRINKALMPTRIIQHQEHLALPRGGMVGSTFEMIDDGTSDYSSQRLLPESTAMTQANTAAAAAAAEIAQLEDIPAGPNRDLLLARARARLQLAETGDVTEESLLKLEMKNRVTMYANDYPLEAVRLIKSLLNDPSND